MVKKIENNYFNENFWRRVENLLIRKNISKKELSRALGISPTSLANLLHDSTRYIRLDLALKVSDFFSVPLYYFLDDSLGPLTVKKAKEKECSIIEDFAANFHNNVDYILKYTPLFLDSEYQPYDLIEKLNEYAEALIEYENKKRYTQEFLFFYNMTVNFYSDEAVIEWLQILESYTKNDEINKYKRDIEQILKKIFDKAVEYELFNIDLYLSKSLKIQFPDKRTYQNSSLGSRALFINRFWTALGTIIT